LSEPEHIKRPLLTRRTVIGGLGAAVAGGLPALAAAKSSAPRAAPSGSYIVDGYADRQSYRPGERATLYLNGSQSIRTRIGLYDLTWRRVDSYRADIAPQLPEGPSPWEHGFGYRPSVSFTVPNVRSGVYLVDGRVPVMVRTPVSARPDVVVVCPTNTAAAYNSSGGRSMYTRAPDTATTVSFQRPAARPLPDYADLFMSWIAPLNLPYAFRYCADVDLEDYGEIAGAKVLVLIGHSEYWTRRARENFDRYVLEGGNALVLSGNTMWWQVRYSDDRSQLICYKWQRDPVSDPLAKTLNWPDAPLQYPVVPSLGVDFLNGGYADDPTDAGWDGFKILLPESPVFRGIPVQRGEVISMRSHEYDGAPLLNTPVTDGEPRLDMAAMGAYRAEIIGYDYGRSSRGGGDTVGTWIAMQRTTSSGTLINGASTDWCGMAGIGGKHGDRVKQIILNMIAILANRERVFVT
jgi:hypothetical protein